MINNAKKCYFRCYGNLRHYTNHDFSTEGNSQCFGASVHSVSFFHRSQFTLLLIYEAAACTQKTLSEQNDKKDRLQLNFINRYLHINSFKKLKAESSSDNKVLRLYFR